jgi:hypothetical protein
MTDANINHDLPHPDEDHVDIDNNNTNGGNGTGVSTGSINKDEDDEDDGDVAGPTVEAYVNLAKTACKCFITQCRRDVLNYIYST